MEKESFYIQHMGLRDHEGEPNSFESILKNYRGAQEMDTLLLRDGEIAVINERRLKLTPEQVEVMTLAELEAHLTEQNPAAEKEKTIPSFREFLGLAADADTQLRVELRGSSPEQAIRLADRLIGQVADMKNSGGFGKNEEYPEKRLRFVTFSIPALQEIQSAAAEKNLSASTGLFWSSVEIWTQATPLYDVEKVAEVPDLAEREWNERGIIVAKHFGFTEIELQPGVITERHVTLAHELGLEIGASLVKSEEEAKRLADLGVDHILTEK